MRSRLKLTVAAIRQGEPDVGYPRYIGGAPLDCSGIPGFYETLNAIADPDHRDAAEWFDDYPSAQPVMSASPAGVVHGTKMFMNLPSSTDRQNVIAYLDKLK